jgi:tRNA(fMet)-specific endonuclease VapC
MMLLDTDVLIEILDKRSEKGTAALNNVTKSGETIATSSINLHEMLYGLEKYAKPVKEVLLLPVLDYTKKDATLSARIEFEAEKGGRPVRRTDSMIAAVAIDNNAALYTFDVKHFAPLSTFGLKLFSEV